MRLRACPVRQDSFAAPRGYKKAESVRLSAAVWPERNYHRLAERGFRCLALPPFIRKGLPPVLKGLPPLVRKGCAGYPEGLPSLGSAAYPERVSVASPKGSATARSERTFIGFSPFIRKSLPLSI